MKEKTKQKRKSISKHVKIEDNKDNFYKEEDDFLKISILTLIQMRMK